MTKNNRMKKEKIGVLGGSFDPAHKAHVAFGSAAISEAGLDRLLVMPAYIQPFKREKKVTDEEHRLATARLAFAGIERAEVSSFEIDKQCVSYTFDTLTALTEMFPDAEIYFATGSDSFMTLDTWYKGKEMLRKFSFITALRPSDSEEMLDSKIAEFQAVYGTKVIKLKTKMLDISSTKVRNAYAAGEDVSELIPDSVAQYIKANGLYTI